LFHDGGIDVPRTDAIHANSIPSAVFGEATRQHDHTRLGGAMCGGPDTTDLAHDRRDVDDDSASSGHKIRPDCLAKQIHASQVGVENPVPVGYFQVGYSFRHIDSGVVDECVHAPGVGQYPLDARRNIAWNGNVRGDRDKMTRAGHRVRTAVQPLPVDIDPIDGCAFTCEGGRHGVADAGGRAGDDRHFAGEAMLYGGCRHGLLPGNTRSENRNIAPRIATIKPADHRTTLLYQTSPNPSRNNGPLSQSVARSARGGSTVPPCNALPMMHKAREASHVIAAWLANG